MPKSYRSTRALQEAPANTEMISEGLPPRGTRSRRALVSKRCIRKNVDDDHTNWGSEKVPSYNFILLNQCILLLLN